MIEFDDKAAAAAPPVDGGERADPSPCPRRKAAKRGLKVQDA